MRVNAKEIVEQKILYRKKGLVEIKVNQLDQKDKDFDEKLMRVVCDAREISFESEIVITIEGVVSKDFEDFLKSKIAELQSNENFRFFSFNFAESARTLEL
ncbi:hypothetical protein P5E66_06310 [Clostridium perfringens]|nr:hypothetical protein [Clostridium perfringens]